MDLSKEITKLGEQINNCHFMPGINYQKMHRMLAINSLEKNELEAICHLVEVHSPTLRYSSIIYQQQNHNLNTVDFQIEKAHCAPFPTKMALMMEKLQEMPHEWTLVQLTSTFHMGAFTEINPDKRHTTGMFISVMECGQSGRRPFCWQIARPLDPVTKKTMEIAQEMHNIIAYNKETLSYSKDKNKFDNGAERKLYYGRRQEVDDRLTNVVKDLQRSYLREWRCLLSGKYLDENLESTIKKRILIFQEVNGNLDLKTQSVIYYLLKGYHCLTLTEVHRALQRLFPKSDEVSLRKNVFDFIKNLSKEFNLEHQKKHPLILIVDEILDFFPWEMIDVLLSHPVSRLPTFHLVYALYKRHQSEIINGHKIVHKPENGRFIVNPNLDLNNMQKRIVSFLKYWTPRWKGLVAEAPSKELFSELLTNGEIFVYFGHGSGCQYLSMERIVILQLTAVILLFGCSSTKLYRTHPDVEMFGPYQMYLLAGSPSVVGMLWEVTDLDTDILSTDFISRWIPNSTAPSWSAVDKSVWKKGATEVKFPNEGLINVDTEPELLRALCAAKKSDSIYFMCTRAACVARGLPIRICKSDLA